MRKVPENKRIYLCQPTLEVVTRITGICMDTVVYTEHVKDYHELRFTVDEYRSDEKEHDEEEKKKKIKSDGYDMLHVGMLLYLEDIGYFQMQEPSVNFDGYHESKEVVAYAAYKEFEDKDLVDFSVNTGLDGSLERYEENLDDMGFAKEYVVFYREDNPKLSLMHLVLEKLPRWSIGYIDPIIGYDEETRQFSRFSFEVDTMNVYAFLNSTVAPCVHCVFDFDHLNFKVNAYSTLNYGSYTNIVLTQRNLIQSMIQSTTEDSVFTRFNATGSDGLDVRNWNYNDPRIINLDYYLQDQFIPRALADKIRAWLKYRDDHRNEFAELARQLAAIEDKISEIQYRVPNDGDNWKQWDGMELDLLNKNLKYYNALLESLQVSVDPDPQYEEAEGGKAYLPWKKADGTIDHDRYLNALKNLENGYGGYYTYMEAKDYILPNIRIAIDNFDKNSEDKSDYVEGYETNWDLYGIQELKGLVQKHEGTLKTYAEFQKPWSSLTDEEKAKHPSGEEYYNKNHKQYQDTLELIGDAKTSDSIKGRIAKLQEEVNLLEASKEPVNQQRKGLIDNASVDNERWFDAEERLTVYGLFRDTDYTNEHILTTSIDTALSTIDVQKTLYDNAVYKLSEVSRPQYEFRINTDNMLALEEFKDWEGEFQLGNYIWACVRDDYAVKLRIIGKTWNPCDTTPDMVLEFSNMITSLSGRNDLTSILNYSNTSGKNRVSSGIGNSKDVEEYMTRMLQLMKNSQIFNNMVGSAVDSSIVGNGSFGVMVGDYLQAAEINVGKIKGETGEFNELFSKYINTDYMVSNVSVTEMLKADQILVNDVHGGSGTYTGVLKGVKIVGDDIEAETIIANKIVLRGQDTSLVYQLNELGDLDTSSMTAEELKKYQFDAGKTIIAKSITATQIDVENLWAATIEALEVNTKGLSAITAKIGNWEIHEDNILGNPQSYIRGGILESPNYRIDANGNVTSGCQVDLNNGIVSARNFVINANNFTLDKDGNAAYKGMVNADQLTVGLNPNLMPNGLDTFEQYTEVPCISKSTQLPVSIDNTVHYYGSRSLKLGKNSYVGVSVVLGESVAKDGIKVKSNKKYRISCYTKHDGTSEKTIRLMAVGYKTDFTSMDYIKQPFSVKEGEDWKRISFVYTASQEYPYLTIGIELRNSQINAWFDAFQVEEVENDSQEPGAFKPAGTTFINGNNVTTGIIASSNGKFKIDLDNELITAENLALDSDYLQITKDGKLTCTSGIFTGEVNATSGIIAGWNLNNYAIWRGSASWGNSSGMYFGNSGLSIKDKFKVSSSGVMTCTDGTFTGTVNAISGAIAGWNLNSSSIWKGNENWGNASGMYFGDNGLSIKDKFKVSSSGVVNCTDGTFTGTVNATSGTIGGFTISGGDLIPTYPSNPGSIHSYQLRASDAVFESGVALSQKYAAISHSHTTLTDGSYSAQVNSSTANFRPSSDDTMSLGGSSRHWTQVYATKGTISTSDENEKTDVSEIDERYEKLFMDLRPVNYMWKENGKNNPDRIHCGLIAQEVNEAAENNGLDSKSFAAICMDQLEEPTEDGRTERWGLRYGELHGLEIHMTQKALKKIEILEEENKDLKDKLEHQSNQIAQLAADIEKLKALLK